MHKLLTSTILILSWTLVIGLLLHSFSTFYIENTQGLSIGFSLYTLSIGSFIFLKESDNPTNQLFLAFTSALAFFFLLIPIASNLLTAFLLSFSLILFEFFLTLFIQSKKGKRLKLRLLFLSLMASLSLRLIYPDHLPKSGYFLLISAACLTFYHTLKKEKDLFFNSKSYQILRWTIIGIFLPLIGTLFLPDSYFNLSLFLITLLPTSMALFLIKEQLLLFPQFLFEALILFFSSFIISFFLMLLKLSTAPFPITFSQLLLTTSLVLFILNIGQRLQIKQFQKQQRAFSNEKVELLNQATYADFLQQASALLVTRLTELTESENILLLAEKQGTYLTLCQKGISIKHTILQQIPKLSLHTQSLMIQQRAFQSLRIRQSEGVLWLFFEKTSKEVPTSDLIDFIQQYAIILKMVRLLHDSQKKNLEAPLQAHLLLQEKLFNSIETEKVKQTNYLHDEVLQTVIALQTLTTLLEGEDEIKSLLTIEFSKLIYSIRRQIFETTPSTLYHLTFEENIAILIEDFNQRYRQTNFSFDYQGDCKLPRHIIPPVYRMIKELNENIGKHAKATLATTSIQVTAEQLILLITDNGIGLTNFEQLEKDLIHKKGHIGLLSIKNDVNWLNGSFQLLPSTKTATGVKIQIIIPFKEREDFYENTVS